MLNRLRLFPILAVVAALALAVKVSGIWNGVDAPLGVNVVQAQESQDPAGDQAPASGGEGEVAALPEEESAPAILPGEAGVQFSRAEVDMLQNLASRREDLDAREREIELRANLLQAAEIRINQKIEELKAIEARVDALIEKHDEQEERKLRSLVQIYETMKPKEAARIFEELDLNILIDVAERMNERRLAPILAQMTPALAKDVTVAIRTRKQLPLTGG